MHQLKHMQISFTRVRLFSRVFLLGLLLMGSLSTATPLIFSSSVLARAAQKTPRPDVSSFKPHAVVSPQKGVVTRSHSASQLPQGQSDRSSKTLGAAPVTTRPIEKVRPHGSVPQDLTITSSAPGGPNFQVGQTFTIELVMNNTTTNTTFTANSGAGMSVTFPIGLSNMVVATNSWSTNLSATTSPAVFSSLYTGAPVSAGGVFTLVTISGVITSDAAPIFKVSPRVFDSQHAGLASGGLSVNISPIPGTAIVTPTVTGTVTPTPVPLTSPDVHMTVNVAGGLSYQVGQNVTINLITSNINVSKTLDVDDGVYIGDVLPFGLNNLSALGGGNWSVNTSATTGPALFTAIYTGSPIAPGGTFPPITITGTLTSDAVPGLRNSTAVFDNNFVSANVAVVLLTVTPAGTVTPTPTPTSIPSPTPLPTITPILPPQLPDLSLTQSSVGSNMFQVGQTINYALNVSSTATGGPVGPSNMIKVVAVFPVGLKNVTTTGLNWSIMSTSAISPTLIVATYRGLYPVATGTPLPPIHIQGTVLNTAVPQLTSTALLQVAGDSHADNNLANTTIQVSTLAPTLVPQPSPTPTSVVVPTVTVSSVIAPLLTSLPDLAVIQSSIGTSPFVTGQQLGYVLSVKNVGVTGSVSGLIRLTEVIPIGLTNVSISVGPSWHITQSSTTSPLMISATYAGSYPVTPGMTLAPILVIGKISNGIISSMTCTAVVGVAGDRNPNNNMANNTVFVIPSLFPQSSADAQRQSRIHEPSMKKI